MSDDIHEDLDPDDGLQAYLTERVHAEYAIREEWAERSLTDPEGRGVLIVHDPRTHVTTYELHESVPWATFHEYPYGRNPS